MTDGRVFKVEGYAGVVLNLARQAIGAAFDTAPHRPPQGELRWAMAETLPASRVLIQLADDKDRDGLGPSAEALMRTVSEPNGKVTDGFGHTRPVYAYLAIHLLSIAANMAGNIDAVEPLRRAGEYLLAERNLTPDPRLTAWGCVIARELGLSSPDNDWSPVPDPTPLMPLGLNDLIDAWTYNELVGLHGLYLRANIEGREDLTARVNQAARYHLGHTQPDYTTYQPWGLAAFASDPQTVVFAEQQLHDVATHLSIEGPGGAVLPALLLSDAYAMMSGRLAAAWAHG